MNKIQKIIEARAVIKGSSASLEANLSKLLSAKDKKALETEIQVLNTAYKLLEASIIRLDPAFQNKLAKLL